MTHKLLPVRVAKCERPGLLSSVVRVDVFGVSEDEARERIRRMVANAMAGRAKPTVPPRFPGTGAAAVEPRFPGMDPPSPTSARSSRAPTRARTATSRVSTPPCPGQPSGGLGVDQSVDEPGCLADPGVHVLGVETLLDDVYPVDRENLGAQGDAAQIPSEVITHARGDDEQLIALR